ncbi:hypothetical protein WR51_28785 (plasmid) [Bacillus cereus]|nr:hypothetical protein WR47_29880 [Bacillus cereus]ANC16937.1 hypothetical protein WR51_28785 [Bacillus cereus]
MNIISGVLTIKGKFISRIADLQFCIVRLLSQTKSVHMLQYCLSFRSCVDMYIQYFYLIPITIVLQTLYIIFKPTISRNCKTKTDKFPNKLKTNEKLTRNLNKIFSIYLNFNLMESGLNNDAIQGNILLNRITETILLMQDKLKISHLIL